MVYTVTLNPAYDKTLIVSDFKVGGTNKVQTVTAKTGGKGLNVSRILNALGVPNIALGFADESFSSAATMDGIKNDFVITETPVRTNIKISDIDIGVVTELNENGAEVSEVLLYEIYDKLEKYLIKDDIVVFTGSLPPGVPDDIYRTWIEKCNKNSIITILDTSGEALREGIKAKPYMIKPNLDEFSYLSGRQLVKRYEILAEVNKLINAGIKKVLISMKKPSA